MDKYLGATYKDGGRGPVEYDCWGLVRDARSELFGKPLLPSYGSIPATQKAALTQAAKREAKAFHRSKAEPGAIVTCWRGQLCLHVALIVNVDGRIMALEIDEKGPRLSSVRRLESQFQKVIYFND